MYKRGAKRVVCSHPNGSSCTAYESGKCIALYNTRFPKPCPFFRDMGKMSEEERDKYRIFVNRMEEDDG